MVVHDLNRRQFAMLGAASAATWCTRAEAETGSAMLYPREELTEAAGYPALVRFEPGRRDLPLVVFVTGGGVLGRIAYGPPGGRPADFLCHWLHAEGFASLVLSYPIDSRAVFDAAFPQFSITDWAEQSAEIIARYVDRNGLPENAIVLGWSMAGRIAEPLHAALRRKGKGIELFVAMAGRIGASQYAARSRRTEAGCERPRRDQGLLTSTGCSNVSRIRTGQPAMWCSTRTGLRAR